MGRFYLILMCSLGLLGAMAGRMNPSSDSSVSVRDLANQADSGESSSSADSSEPRRSGDEIVLNRRSDGHFYADVRLNGTTVNMMIDTGASGIALSKDDAERAGIATSIGMDRDIGEGAGGTVYGDVVKVGRVQLGDVEQEDVPAVVLKGGELSLMGQSFLREFGSVKIEGDEMVLR